MEALSWRYGLMSEGPFESSSGAREVVEAENTLGSQQRKVMPVRGKWGEAMSFKEVGKKMKVSAEYGRRLCHAALEKLRCAAEEGAIEPALLF